jgi:hypothetical protein
MSGKPVSYKITGLTRGKQYYFRVTATNPSGTVLGMENSFVTQSAPTVVLQQVTEIKRNSATLRAQLNPHGLETKYQFEYGITASYGSKAPVPQGSLGPEPGAVWVNQVVSGLEPNTLYHYRPVAENAFGTAVGPDKTFTTLPNVNLNVKGKLVEVGAPLKVFSSNLTFKNGEATYSCTETEFSGTVGLNPGAVQNVSTTKMLGPGGGGCIYTSFVEIKFSIPTKGMSLEYTVNKAGEGVAQLSKFTLVGAAYFGASLMGTCEYEVELSGTYKLGVALNLALAGPVKLVKITGSCPGDQSVSGEFQVTSSGSSVEAKT